MKEQLFTQEELKALATKCWRSPVEFARIFLPHWFPTKMPWVHRGLAALMTGQTDFLLDFGREQWQDGEAEWTIADLKKILDNFLEEGTNRPIFILEMIDDRPTLRIDAKRNIGAILPRGFSKTTLVNMLNLRDAVYHNETFFLYVSESAPHAERQLGTIKYEMEDNDGAPNNELLNVAFGNQAPGRQDPLKWTEKYIETLKGVMIGAVGRGGQIRGFGKRAKRPGKIVFDDIEDEESVASDTQRKKDSSWFFRAAVPAVRKGGRCIAIGTILHTDAILNKLMLSSEWTVVRFGAIDKQGDALWPFMMDLAAVDAKKQAAAEVGELSGFFMEYMSEFKDDEARKFPENKLIYIHKDKAHFIGMALAMDPAISEQKRAAMCAYAVTGIEAGGHKHVLESYGKVGMQAEEQIDKFFELHFTWMAHLPPECQKHGIEAMAYQRALLSLVRAEMYKKSKLYGQAAYFEVLPIFHGRTSKIIRVEGILRPLIWGGGLSFEERNPSTHTQLTDWPSGLKDIPDVIAMSVALLDPYAALNLSAEGEAVDFTADGPPLEAVLGGDFRSAP